jgi:hypothetical protein
LSAKQSIISALGMEYSLIRPHEAKHGGKNDRDLHYPIITKTISAFFSKALTAPDI